MNFGRIGKKLSRFVFKKVIRKGGRFDRPFTAAVVPAAGSARRMEGVDKILASFCGEPVIARTLAAFQTAECIDEIVVVTRPELIAPIADIVKQKGFTKVTKIIAGGDTRAESVLLGMEEVSAKTSYIAIHDGARPLVTGEVIAAAVSKAWQTGAAVPQIPVTDTVKKHADGVITGTLDREELCLVQTPQVFDADVIRAALTKAVSEGLPITDDASAAELCGVRVYLTPGSPENIKITTKTDLVLAEALIKEREKA